MDAAIEMHHRLVVVPAQHENDVGVPEGVDQIISVGDGVKAQMRRHDDGLVLRGFGQRLAKIVESVLGDWLRGVVEALIIFREQGHEPDPALIERVAQ